MQIFLPNVDLALTLAMWERQRESLCENENSMSSFNQKNCFFIKHVDFSLEKCEFGAHKGVLHYVSRRELAILRKHDHFELEICVKARGGRTALQPEASLSLICQPVKHGALPRECTPVARTETPLYAFSRAIDRESLAGLGNSLKLNSLFNDRGVWFFPQRQSKF